MFILMKNIMVWLYNAFYLQIHQHYLYKSKTPLPVKLKVVSFFGKQLYNPETQGVYTTTMYKKAEKTLFFTFFLYRWQLCQKDPQSHESG